MEKLIKMKKGLLIFAIALITQVSYWQWSKGKGFCKLTAWYLKTDEHYTNTGDIDSNATRSQFNVNLYNKCFIYSKLYIVAYVPFYARATQNNIVSSTTGYVIQKGKLFLLLVI